MTHSRGLRWGILGTGTIASKFATGMQGCDRAILHAAASRRPETAAAFTEQFGGKAFTGYQSLLADPAIDAVYISLPNGLHAEWTLAALAAGKHVLCEKPLAANAPQAESLFQAATAADRTVMEAFMYRCQPGIQRAIDMVQDGAVGDVRLIRTNFCFCREASHHDARYQPEQAGGALMDVGCYCVHFARNLTGREPADAHAIAHIHAYGVDDYAAGTLRFGDATLAVFTCGMTVRSDWTAVVAGTEGFLTMDNPWLGGAAFTLTRGNGAEVESFDGWGPCDPYALEMEHFAAVVLDAAPPLVPPSDSIGNLRVLDALRRQIDIPV